jgi:hypothetical protein
MENEQAHATGQKPRNTHSRMPIRCHFDASRPKKRYSDELVEDHDPEQDGHIGD